MASPAPANATPYASASLYVGDLIPEVSEALLFEIFNDVGPVASVRVCRDAATRRSLGYAYVNFHRAEDAERALDTMNFKPIRSRPCRIMWSHRDPSLRKTGLGNIFVKNLAPSIDNKTLFDTFSMFGNILSCKVAVDADRKSLGYGFVHYESEEAATNAIEKADSKMIAGQKIEVKAFKSKKERQGGSATLRFTNIYAKNLPESSTEESVRELFGKYGTITSVNVPQTKDDEGKTISKGFAFVNFATPEEAAKCVEEMNDSTLDDKILYVGRAQKKEEREKELREQFEQRKAEQQKKYAGVNLYIKNLNDTMQDDVLRAEFTKFGDITSCRIMRDSAGKSKGFGFVCFSTPEEATKAVTAMNGHMLDGKPLYVALAQRKEFRRAQLEAQHAQRQKGMGMPQPQMYPPQGAPMFYQNMAQRAAMMGYPQQMVARRYPNGPMMGVRGQPMNYQLMPVGGVRGQPGPNRGNNRRGRGSGSQPNRKSVGQNVAGGQQQGYAYNEKVRNNTRPVAATAAAPHPQTTPQPDQTTQDDFAAQLANASAEQRRQMIGEKLYPLVAAKQPEEAGKITGMLLEMDDNELISLLDSESALDSKISEAIIVLEQHIAQQNAAAATAQ